MTPFPRHLFKTPRKLPKKDIIIALIVVLVGTASFAMGKLSNLFYNREPVKIEYGDTLVASAAAGNQTASAIQSTQLGGSDTSTSVSASATPKTTLPLGPDAVVAAKKGTKYYSPTCSGAKRINEENKIWFGSPEEARKAGYLPSTICKGLR